MTPTNSPTVVEVDVKTVRRWLGGRTPYPRLRARVAQRSDTKSTSSGPRQPTESRTTDGPEIVARRGDDLGLPQPRRSAARIGMS